MSVVSIFVNSEPREVPAGTDVAGLLTLLALPQTRVAVEINKQIVPRANWIRPLSAEDRVEVVAFVGGG